MKNQKGFIQIPILIAIIVGVLVLGGVGYFGLKEYKNYQNETAQKEKQDQSTKDILSAQQKILASSTQELEQLKKI